MKKSLILVMMALMSLFIITSCSDSSSSSILTNIPAEAEVVAVGDMKTILESAGISLNDSKLKLPAYITDNMSSSDENEFDEINDIIKKGCIDIDCAAMMINKMDSNDPLIIFRTTDPEKFVAYLEDEDFKEKDSDEGVTYFSKKTYESEYGNTVSFIAVNGNIVYFMPEKWLSPDDNQKALIKRIKNVIEDAKENNFASTDAGKYITSGNAAGVAITIPRSLRQEMRRSGMPSELLDLCGGSVCIKSDVSGNTATAEMKILDENGKPLNTEAFNKYCKGNAKISKSALGYIGKDEQLVFATSLKDVDWDTLLDDIAETSNMPRSERGMLNLAKGYLENINGTVACGIGLNNGIESVVDLINKSDIPSTINITILAETVDGKAKRLANDLKGILDNMGVDYDKTADGFKVDAPGMNCTMYCNYTDNMIVIANHQISKNNDNAAVAYMPSAAFSAAFVVKSSDKLMKDLGVTDNLSMSMSSGSDGALVMKADVTGKYGVIGNFIDMMVTFFKESDKLYRDRRQASYDYSYDDYEYEEYVEEYVDPDSIEVVEAEW